MSRTLNIILWLGVTLAGAGIAAGALVVRDTTATAPPDTPHPAGAGSLDGRTFTGMLGPEGEPQDVADTFVFEKGTFVSGECALRCDFPARSCTASRTTDGWTFAGTTRCPDKNATIVWTGTVEGDTLTGVATWTMRRWYRTPERDFTFEARLQSRPARNAGPG